jgi:uncharacterized Zn-binding protein involved in type VI secretion
LVGSLPAWRALPAAVAGTVDSISSAMDSFMKKPAMTPTDATADLMQISQSLIEGGTQAALAGAPSAAATAVGQLVTLNAANVAATSIWSTASVLPAGQPAANKAYAESIKGAAAAAATAVMSAMAGLADMHVCPIPVPIPPHGPGFVTKGSSSVLINQLPACRMNDKVMEACGGADPIALGCATVDIGDSGGSGGSGGAAGSGASGDSSSASAPPAAQPTGAAKGAFASAAERGTPLIARKGCECPDA